MATYLYTWNRENWDWDTLESDVATCRKTGFFDEPWSCGVTKRIEKGDRAFLVKLGKEAPTGIMASGTVKSSKPFEDTHYSDPNKTANFTNVRWDVLLNYTKEPLLPIDQLPEGNWTPRASGISIDAALASQLEQLWSDHVASVGLSPVQSPEEIPAPEQFWEGAIRTISVNAYERNPHARETCIQHYGSSCSICGMDFGKVYGALGEGFIHVHHRKPLAGIGEEYEIDPVADLIPVCPNCHAMLHRQNPPVEPDELRKILTPSG